MPHVENGNLLPYNVVHHPIASHDELTAFRFVPFFNDVPGERVDCQTFRCSEKRSYHLDRIVSGIPFYMRSDFLDFQPGIARPRYSRAHCSNQSSISSWLISGS